MTVSEKEHIEQILEGWRGWSSSLAGQITLEILEGLQERFEAEAGHDITYNVVWIHCDLIGRAATILRGSSARWTYQKRFSEALYHYHFIREGHDTLGVYESLMAALQALDAQHQDQFDPERALDLLWLITDSADRLQREVDVD